MQKELSTSTLSNIFLAAKEMEKNWLSASITWSAFHGQNNALYLHVEDLWVTQLRFHQQNLVIFPIQKQCTEVGGKNIRN